MVGGDGQLSEPLEVEALSCDTVDQVKLKILAVFKAKFGFAYNIPLRDVRLGGYRRGHTATPLSGCRPLSCSHYTAFRV